MRQPARSPREPVINRKMATGIAVVGIVDMIAILGVFALALQLHPGHLEAAQTMAFITLCTSELIRAFAARSEQQSIFAIGVFSNRWMVGAVALSFVLVLAVVYTPFLAPFFDTVPPSANDWLVMLPFFFASPLAMELLKVYFRRQASHDSDAKAPANEGARAVEPSLE
jgi:Ca2+-transporting ATPase